MSTWTALRRFWQTAGGFWRGTRAWALLAMLVVGVVLQVLVQYRLNYWNRDFFNALEARDSSHIWHLAQTFIILIASSVFLAVMAVWGRMTFQRLWRAWLTSRLIQLWLEEERYQRAGFVDGQRQNAEYRITEDARLATDAPIDFVVGLLGSLLSAGTFVTVLWRVGGVLDIPTWNGTVGMPGYLVAAAIIYAAIPTLTMMLVGRSMVDFIERKNQAEADFKYVVARVNTRTTLAPHAEDGATLATAQENVIGQWKHLCWQYMRGTIISQGNALVVPVIGLLLCTPNYVMGRLTLGEVTQAAAAFVAVQSAFNWLVDNTPRLAEWTSSAYRVAVLLRTLDALGGKDKR
jgi:putative ATP-binding cassette transporter